MRLMKIVWLLLITVCCSMRAMDQGEDDKGKQFLHAIQQHLESQKSIQEQLVVDHQQPIQHLVIPQRYLTDKFVREQQQTEQQRQKQLVASSSSSSSSSTVIGYVWSQMPSFSWPWSTTKSDDWDNPYKIEKLTLTNDTMPYGRHYICFANTHQSTVFDVKGRRKVLEFDGRSANNRLLTSSYLNHQATHCILQTMRSEQGGSEREGVVWLYDIKNGGDPKTFLSWRPYFVQIGDRTDLVMFQDTYIQIYDPVNQCERDTISWSGFELQGSMPVGYGGQDGGSYSFILYMKNGDKFFLNPSDKYSFRKFKDSFDVKLWGRTHFIAQVENKLILFEGLSGKELHAVDIAQGDILAEMAMSPDSKIVAARTASCVRGGIVLYDMPEQKEKAFIDLQGEQRNIRPIEFSSDSSLISFFLKEEGSDDATWRCYQTSDGSLVKEFKSKDNFSHYGWVPGQHIYLREYLGGDQREGAMFVIYDVHNGMLKEIPYNHKQKPLAYTSHSSAGFALQQEKDNEVVCYLIKNNTVHGPHTFVTQEPLTMKGAVLSPDGSHGPLLAVGGDKHFYIYDVEARRWIQRFDQQDGNKATSFHFSKNNSFFVAVCKNSIKIYKYNPERGYEFFKESTFKDETIAVGFFNVDFYYVPEPKTMFIVETEQGNTYVYYMNGSEVEKV